MAILICAATEGELEPVRRFVSKQRIGNKVQFLVTGVGVVAATYSLTKFVGSHRPALILQGGVAGCFDENIALGTTVVVQNESIADLGVGIAVDDFGVGYSSLGQLTRLPASSMKIDRSFIMNLPADENSASITEAICDSSTASGFSTSTCLPASAARIAHSTCWLVGSGI